MNISPPIVVDLGNARQDAIRQFGSGSGQLAEDLQEVMRRVRSGAGPARAGRIFVPVIVICQRPEADPDDTVAEVWRHIPGRPGE